MARRLKYDIPGPDWRRDLKEMCEQPRAALFDGSKAADLVVEIGFGRGEFLLELAREHPDRHFLGIDYSFKRVLKFARRLARTEVANIRLVEASAESVVREALEEGEVTEFWVNFPDPWPKARHARRRLIQPSVVADLCGRLRPGGHLFAVTDDVPYAEQMHETLAGESGLDNVYASEWLSEVPGRMQTAYESEWRAEGRRMHFFAYRRRGVAG